MNHLDEQLDRLFRAAQSVWPNIPPEAPYGLDTRVAAQCRQARAGDFWNPAWLLQALGAAVLIMLLSFWPVFSHQADPESDSLQLADTTVQLNNGL